MQWGNCPGPGGWGEWGVDNEVLERGRVVGTGMSGRAGGSGCLEKLERIISEPDQTRKQFLSSFFKARLSRVEGCVMCTVRVSRCECVHAFRPRSRVCSAPTSAARRHAEQQQCLAPALAVCAARPHEPLAAGTNAIADSRSFKLCAESGRQAHATGQAVRSPNRRVRTKKP